MAEYTTLEIAALCQRTERTVQRWLSTNRLKATHLQGNRYEVAEDDLQPFLPHVVVEGLSERISALEQRIEALEAMLSAAAPTKASRSPPVMRETSTSSTLPPGLVVAATFSELHGIGATTIDKAIASGRVAVVRGLWKVGKAKPRKALDSTGRAQFWQWYHEKEGFTPCPDCPHALSQEAP